MKLRQSPRLKDFPYAGAYAYKLTFVTRQRARAFTDPTVVDLCLCDFEKSALRCGFEVLAYCFMPDHLHLLVSGPENASLTEFARRFKQLSSYHSKRLRGKPLWQISYYDHVVRSEEGLQHLAEYIWHNPVRGGLSESPFEYPFSGPRDWMA